ncbi:MAG TPA: thermonuclease family protein [Gemmatimonadales bacterium]|nr:thermonuclease family protein [Gemmatimonadales bacterium]
MRRLIPWLLLLATACSLQAQAASPCVVSHIVDGDTFDCNDGTRVRPIGIDAPERAQGVAADSATAMLARWVPLGDTVRLERDVSLNDRYGRRLAWVWRGDTLVNERMVASGWALLYTVPPDVRHVEALESAQARARKEHRGVWGMEHFTCAPGDFRRKRC